MLKFYYSTATCSTICHIAFEEAGLPFEGIEVSWMRKINVEALEIVNPLGAVPALSINGRSLTETPAILEYIAETNPNANLLAKPGSFERLETMSWVAFANSDLQTAIGNILRLRRLELDDNAKAVVRKSGLERVEKYIAHTDARLAGREFVVGSTFTIADAALFTILGWAKWIEFSTNPYKNVTAYMKRIHSRPAVQKVLKAEGLTDFLQD
jgi:glutathione S-transferase